jgi:hypothetical protein
MKRAAAVVLLAVFTAMVFGIQEISEAQTPEKETAVEKHRRELQERLRKMPQNAVVRVERRGLPRIDGVLQDIGADSITLLVSKDGNRTTVTIRYDEIRDVDELRGHALRNTLIALGIVGVLVGTCAAAAN